MLDQQQVTNQTEAGPLPAVKRKPGRPKKPKPKLRDPHVVERFWAQVNKDTGRSIAYAPWLGECWEWQGTLNTNGYGVHSVGRAKWSAHRYAWSLDYGQPAWPTLDHLCHSYATWCDGGMQCRHKQCVNPDHLEPVSNSENARRRNAWNPWTPSQRRKPAVYPMCVNGHRWGLHLAMYDAVGRRICGDCVEGMY